MGIKLKALGPENPERSPLVMPATVEWLLGFHLVFLPLHLTTEQDLEPIHAHYCKKDPWSVNAL